MKKLKRLFSITMALIMLTVVCISNIGVSAYVLPLNEDEMPYVSENDFSALVDSEISGAVIVNIKAGTKVFNIPETVTNNGVIYPVKHLFITATLGFSNFAQTIETINVGKNIETIEFNFSSSSGYYTNLQTLKTINVPAGSKLTELNLPSCPSLENINLASDSVLESINISSCPKLKKLSLPKKLKLCRVGKDAPKLKVKITKGNKYLKVKGNQILSKDGKKLIDIVGNKSKVTVYKTVKTIKSFSNKYIKKLIIGENVSKIATYSLGSFKNLNIVIKNQRKAPKVGHNAFYPDSKGIRFYVQNKKVAKDLKKKLKGSGIKKAKIIIGKKVVYQNING